MPQVLLMGGRGHDVIGLALVELPMIRGVRPGDDRLGLQHLHRHLVPGFGLHRAGQVVLERQVIDDDQVLAARHDLERARVLAVIDLQDSDHRHETHRGRAPAEHLDLTLPLRGADRRRRLTAEGAAGNVPDHHGPTADFDGADAVEDGHADIRRGGRRRMRPVEAECDGGADEKDQRRPNSAKSSVRTIETTIEMRMEVPSGT